MLFIRTEMEDGNAATCIRRGRRRRPGRPVRSAFSCASDGIEHVVFEKQTAMHVWRNERWDTFCLVTPNWQCQLPGHAYDGVDPHGFMKQRRNPRLSRRASSAKVDAPLREGVAVQTVAPRDGGGFESQTTTAEFVADSVVVASGGYTMPIVPRFAERLPRNDRSAALGALSQRRDAAAGRGAGGRLRPVRRADRGRPASRRAQGASRGRQRAALRPLLSRPRRRRLAGRHGLLRHAGRAASAAAKACATTPTIM